MPIPSPNAENTLAMVPVHNDFFCFVLLIFLLLVLLLLIFIILFCPRRPPACADGRSPRG